MASDTRPEMRDHIIYSVYIRNHSQEGSFRALIPDLPRIKALGADIIWLMPIHPIGEKGKKGSLGCPYAISDYRRVNPCYGSLEDFKALVDAIHAQGMKCLIDVVYNHTSPDAVLVGEHPEFYYRRQDGSFGNKTADWTDVIDLDYSVPALWDYQIESLKMWAAMVDGFRCDVASCVPAAFWRKARQSVREVNPHCIWLAETIHPSFMGFNRLHGVYAGSDGEMFTAFDMEYEYDVREIFDNYLYGKAPLSSWINALNFQDCAYPDNYVKLRFLENHDQPRICSLVKDEASLRNFTAMLYFLKGATMLYAGQEYENRHQPSLFEKDPVDWHTGKNISPLLRTLADIKRNALDAEDCFVGRAQDNKDIAVLTRGNGKKRKLGVFSLRGLSASVATDMPDGDYVNLIDDKPVTVSGGIIQCAGEPVIISQ